MRVTISPACALVSVTNGSMIWPTKWNDSEGYLRWSTSEKLARKRRSSSDVHLRLVRRCR